MCLESVGSLFASSPLSARLLIFYEDAEIVAELELTDSFPHETPVVWPL